MKQEARRWSNRPGFGAGGQEVEEEARMKRRSKRRGSGRIRRKNIIRAYLVF